MFLAILSGVISSCHPGDGSLLVFKPYFDQELKAWTAGYQHFDLTRFHPQELIPFGSIVTTNKRESPDFDSLYGQFMSYSPDKSRFIDCFSEEINLEKKGDHYEANPDDGGAVFLCDRGGHNCRQITYSSIGEGVEESCWLSNTRFALVGVERLSESKRVPFILIGDIQTQQCEKFLSEDSSCVQIANKFYTSPKLAGVRGL